MRQILTELGIEIRDGADEFFAYEELQNEVWIRALFEYTDWPRVVDKLRLNGWWTEDGEIRQTTLDAWRDDVNWYLDFYQ